MTSACKDLGRCVVSYYLTNIVLIICENFYLYNFSKILNNRIFYYIKVIKYKFILILEFVN